MAREGMRFPRFYAGATVCAPSRSVLITGRHHGHSRVRGNAGPANPTAQALRPDDATVACVPGGPAANNERTRALKGGAEVPDYAPYADKD
jgi:hypothetical protein